MKKLVQFKYSVTFSQKNSIIIIEMTWEIKNWELGYEFSRITTK